MAIQTIPRLERHAFFAALAENIARVKTDEYLTLFIVDIADFKRYNRSFGYGTGDFILAIIYNRLKNAFEKSAIHRIGDNEFAVILPQTESPAYAAIAAQKILDEMQHKFQLPDREVRVGVTLGMAHTAGSKKISPQELVQDAERSLFHAKKINKSYVLETPTDEQNVTDYLDLESDFLEAMYSGELMLFYQPKIDLGSEKPVAAEALLRWSHPQRGSIPPHIVVELANRLGKELELGKWILGTALREYGAFKGKWKNFGIAVNVPSSLIHSNDFHAMVINTLKLWGMEAKRLTLEIDEDAIIEGKEFGLDTLAKLRRDGVRISIDDFGTGYSSLNYFRSIPADEIKIDQTFIGNMMKNADDRKVVKLCIDIAHHFGLDVVAEGVEKEAIANALAELQCSYAQGYCYTEPLRVEELVDWLKNNA